MVDYNIVVPQPYDTSSDVANALRFRAAQQAEAENQLKLRAWMEDRAYTLKQRQAAAANAAAEKARKEELLGIYGNFGVTPAVTGARGQSYSGTGVANDPFETTRNKLIQRGFGAQAEDLTKVQNEILTGRKTATETKGLDLKNLNDRLSLLQRFAPMVNSPEDAAAYSRMLTKEFPEFAGISGTPDEAAQRSSAAFAQDPDTWRLHSLNLTAEQLVQANAKAAEAKQPKWTEVDVGGEKQFIDTNPQSPTAGQLIFHVYKTPTPAEVSADKKTAWEQAHPDYTIQETAQGMVAVNKKDPTDVKPIQLGDQTVMPVNKSQVTNINTNLPASEQAQKDYMTNVAKTREALQSAPATLENIERAKELIPEASKFMGTGGEAYLTAAKFLNNRLGTSINVEGIKNAEELRSRLFMGVMDNLKKMDAQPTGRQQEALQEAIGQLDTDPAALPRVLDILGNSLRSKVDIYNRDVTDAESRGVKFPYKPQVDLPAQKVVGENTFPNEAAASQILKQRGARPGDRVRVNIGGRTGTFVVE